MKRRVRFTVQICVSEELRAWIESEAERVGLGVSAWLRSMLEQRRTRSNGAACVADVERCEGQP